MTTIADEERDGIVLQLEGVIDRLASLNGNSALRRNFSIEYQLKLQNAQLELFRVLKSLE